VVVADWRIGGGGHVHDALFYGSDDDLRAAGVPFFRAGFAAGDRAMLACSARTAALLVAALNDDVRISVLPHSELYQRPARTIAEYQRLMDHAVATGAQRVRLIGEIDFGVNRADWIEWCRYEAAVNHALRKYPLWSVCAYDTQRLPGEVLDAGFLTHPNVITTGSRGPNPRYVDPAEFLRRSAQVGPDPLETTRPAVQLDELTDLAPLRRTFERTLAESAVPATTADEFLFAVNEVATNAAVHGRPPVRVRLWSAPDRLLCTVTDGGPGFDNPFAGYVPAHDGGLSHGGRGLWLARQLCRIDMFRTSEGFTVRLAAALVKPS
jgi:anti-sigma regulatory factor (Ser/Thr protein kinase)